MSARYGQQHHHHRTDDGRTDGTDRPTGLQARARTARLWATRDMAVSGRALDLDER